MKKLDNAYSDLNHAMLSLVWELNRHGLSLAQCCKKLEKFIKDNQEEIIQRILEKYDNAESN